MPPPYRMIPGMTPHSPRGTPPPPSTGIKKLLALLLGAILADKIQKGVTVGFYERFGYVDHRRRI